jgi:hypothetical protein
LNIAQSLGELGQRYNNEIKQKRKQKHNEAQAKYVKRKKAIEKLKKLKIVEKIRERLKAKKNSVFHILTEDDYKDDPFAKIRKIFSTQKKKISFFSVCWRKEPNLCVCVCGKENQNQNTKLCCAYGKRAEKIIKYDIL